MIGQIWDITHLLLLYAHPGISIAQMLVHRIRICQGKLSVLLSRILLHYTMKASDLNMIALYCLELKDILSGPVCREYLPSALFLLISLGVYLQNAPSYGGSSCSSEILPNFVFMAVSVVTHALNDNARKHLPDADSFHLKCNDT